VCVGVWVWGRGGEGGGDQGWGGGGGRRGGSEWGGGGIRNTGVGVFEGPGVDCSAKYRLTRLPRGEER